MIWISIGIYIVCIFFCDFLFVGFYGKNRLVCGYGCDGVEMWRRIFDWDGILVKVFCVECYIFINLFLFWFFYFKVFVKFGECFCSCNCRYFEFYFL